MILHTIISENDIFADMSNIPTTHFVNIKGGILELRKDNNSEEIVRLLSTDPYMYIRTEYQPFSKYELTEEQSEIN